jgi:hypothetical protein
MEIPKKIRETEINLGMRISSMCNTILGLSNRRFLYEKWIQVKGCSKNGFFGKYVNLNGESWRTVYNEQIYNL